MKSLTKMTMLMALVVSGGLTTGQTSCDEEEAGYLFAANPPEDYDRVDRMGMPAIATAVISSKDAYNQAGPADDVAGVFVDEIVASVEVFHGALDDDLSGAGLTPCPVDECVGFTAPLILPDTLTIDASSPAGFPNGRRLADPVMDVTLAIVLLDMNTHTPATLAELPLNPPANDAVFNTIFPYLATPHMP